MSTSTASKQRELLSIQSNTEETHKHQSGNEQLIEYKKIERTPFTIARYEEKYNLLMGKYKLNEEPLKSEEEVLKYIEDYGWNITMSVITIVFNDLIEDGLRQKNKDTIKAPTIAH